MGRMWHVTLMDQTQPAFYGVVVGSIDAQSEVDGRQIIWRVVKVEGEDRLAYPLRPLYEREIDGMRLCRYNDTEGRRVRRCEAHARKGTGYGTCDEPLDDSGGCLYASTHVEPA